MNSLLLRIVNRSQIPLVDPDTNCDQASRPWKPPCGNQTGVKYYPSAAFKCRFSLAPLTTDKWSICWWERAFEKKGLKIISICQVIFDRKTWLWGIDWRQGEKTKLTLSLQWTASISHQNRYSRLCHHRDNNSQFLMGPRRVFGWAAHGPPVVKDGKKNK